MDINKFIEEERERLEAFNKFWIEQSKLDPELFPLDLNSGDWIEQFTIFKDKD